MASPRIKRVGELTTKSVNMRNGNAVKYWKVRLLLVDGKRKDHIIGRVGRGEGCMSRQQAKTELANFMREAVNRPVATLKQGRATLRAWCDHVADEVKSGAKPATRSIYKTVGRYLVEAMGADTRLTTIDKQHAERFKARLSAGELADARVSGNNQTVTSAATVKKYITTARAIFNEAVRAREIDDNPFADVDVLVPESRDEWHYVTHDEAEALLAQCSNVGWQAMVALCRWGGLRRGEARDLEWSTVDLEARTMRVWTAKTERTRSSGNWRTVPINDRLLSVLGDARMVLGKYVVTDHVGRSVLDKTLRAVMRRAGVAWGDPFHDLRRARCQDLAAAGVPVKDAAEMMGHSVAVMMRYYVRATSAGFNHAMAV